MYCTIMNDLKNFNNLFASLAHSAYEGKEYSFSEALMGDDGNIVRMDYRFPFSNQKGKIKGGKFLANNGIVYLHRAITEPYDNVFESETEQNINYFENDTEGFKSYYLTDTEKLNLNTKNVYLSVKGSDEPSFISYNDWALNNLPFTLWGAYIPQGQLVNAAVKKVLSEMRESSPNAKLNLTGHSLGTIATIQGVANLTVEELEQIGEIVLFDGPDALKSIQQMHMSEEKLKILNEKVTYYVNPFDVVSMLNRNTDTQIGKVKVIIPFNFVTTFDKPSSHDFGEYRIHSDGKILEATEDFFPDYLTAGKKLSKLINKYVNIIKAQMGVTPSVLLEIGKFLIKEFLSSLAIPTDIKYLYSEFMKEYKAIIDETKQAVIAWGNKNIPILQAAIQGATGAKKIELRSRLLLCISHLSRIESDEKVKVMKNELENYRQQVKEVVEKANHEAYHAGVNLGRNEVSQLVSQFQFSTVWDEGMFSYNVDELNRYIDKIYRFSDKLFTAVETLEDVDRKQSEIFKVVSNSSFSLNSYKIERG